MEVGLTGRSDGRLARESSMAPRTWSLSARSKAGGQPVRDLGIAEKAFRGTAGGHAHRLKSFSSTQREVLRRSRGDTHKACDMHTPTEVEFNLMNRVIVSRNSGSSDSPSVLMIPGAFSSSTKRRGIWAVRSASKILSASLSMSDTGTPEFVSRICIPWLVRRRGRKQTAHLPGCVWCVRSHQPSCEERKGG